MKRFLCFASISALILSSCFIHPLPAPVLAQAPQMQMLIAKPNSAAVTPIALIIGAAISAPDANTATTAGVNTTGANFLVCAVAYFDLVGPPTITDSKSNTWTLLTVYNTGASASVRIAYAINPTVGSSHTFTASLVGSYPGIACGAFSNVNTSAPLDTGTDTGATSSGAVSIQPGTSTPNNANSVVITVVSITGNPAATVNAPFTVTHSIGPNTGEGVGLAYDIQTTATARNPTWDFNSTSLGTSAAIATFKHN